MCWFQIITIYVWHLRTRKYFCLINEVIFFVHISFETFSSLYVSSILMRTAAWRSRALQICAYWVLLLIYNVWQKHCDWEVFMYGRCLRSAQINISMFTTPNCPRSALTSIQQMNPRLHSVRFQEAFRSQGPSVKVSPCGERRPWAWLIMCTSTAPPTAPTSTPLSRFFANPPFLCSCLPSQLLYLPLIICPCPPSADVSAPLLQRRPTPLFRAPLCYLQLSGWKMALGQQPALR